MHSEIKKVNKAGIEITVKWSAGMVNRDLDGVVCSQDRVSYCVSVTLTKDGEELLWTRGGYNSLSTTYPDMPAGAKGVIRGYRGKKEIAQPVAAETYDLIEAAIIEAQEQAESDLENPEPKKETALVINPAYADMSADEIKAAERRFDDINNEGAEGYNPYRDNLYLTKEGK